MIPQVGGFQGCYLDNHRNNWRCARAVPALCEDAPLTSNVIDCFGPVNACIVMNDDEQDGRIVVGHRNGSMCIVLGGP